MSAARELAARNINVNAVAPGFIATDSEIKDMDDEFIKSEILYSVVERVALFSIPMFMLNLTIFSNISIVINMFQALTV